MSKRSPDLSIFRGFSVIAICVTVLAACIPEPRLAATAPSNLSATGDLASITLTWDASSAATSYAVKRSTVSGGPYMLLANSIATNYTDAAVTPGTVYYYVVSSVDTRGESANSQPVAASTATIPAPPADLQTTDGNAQVSVGWSASVGATSYRVKRATVNGGPYTVIASPTAITYLDTSVTNETTYFYVVSAVNVAGESPNSAQVSAFPAVLNPPPSQFGTWTNVTPAGVDLTSDLCSNYGTTSVQRDPARPSHLYTLFHCQGIWRSTDYGLTWAGPINTGTNGATVSDCSGSLSVVPSSTAAVPTIYAGCIRGLGTGLWKSTDGGVNWTSLNVLGLARQDYYPPAIDPYDHNHLLVSGHELTVPTDNIMESTDGGQSWSRVRVEAGMLPTLLNPLVFFIDTGSAASTRSTWLWVGDASGGAFGTWRTTNGGTSWARVESHEQATQIYQVGSTGVIYMGGKYSVLGSGVLRSNDYGQTWRRVGLLSEAGVVFGSSKNVYSMYGFAVGPGGTAGPSFQVGSQPGTGQWVAPTTPPSLRQGPAQVAVLNDGANNIIVGAMRNDGLWRYVEP